MSVLHESCKELAERPGRVVRVEPGMAWVAIEPAAACGSCGNLACGRGLRWRDDAPVAVPDPIGVAPGETVVVGVPVAGLMRGAVTAWLLPALAVAAGAVGGDALGGDVGAMVGAVAGLVFGLLWVRSRSSPTVSALGPVLVGHHPQARTPTNL